MDPGLLLVQAMQMESTESVAFLNEMVEHLWPYINVSVSAMIKDIVEPMFADLLPGPFKNTKFTLIDLGSVPMKFDSVDVHTRRNDSIKLDMDVHWDGSCDIDLKSPIIGGYGVKRVELSGRLSIVMQPLVPVMPVVSAIQLGFINPPTLNMNFTGVADIADVSLISGSIRKIINNVFADLFVLPNRLLVPINPGNDFFSTYILPLGVVRVKLESGAGFKTTGKLIKDVPDVYVKLRLGGEKKLKSSTCKNSNDPQWDETFDFVYCDKEQFMQLYAWDNDVAGDDKQGGIIFPIGTLLEAPDQRKEFPIKLDGVETGSTVTLSAEFLERSSLKSNFDIPMDVPNQLVGILTVIVAGAEDIPDHPDLAPYCEVKVGGSERKFFTPVVKKCPGMDPRAPIFNSIFRVPLTQEIFKEAPSVEFELFTGEHSMGTKTVSFGEVMNGHEMKYRKDFEMDHGATLHTCVVLNSLSA